MFLGRAWMPSPVLVALALALLGASSCSPEVRDFSSGVGGPGEACFDGVDNDGDGDADCADADCGAGAVCVASPEGLAIGVLVDEAEACPEGFAEEAVLHRGLKDPGCEGCGCTPDPVSCTAYIYYYTSEQNCIDDFNQVAGIYAGEYGFVCDSNAPISPESGGVVGGLRASAYKITESCTPSGAGTPAPPTWEDSRKFCRTTRLGAGCDPGQACVARQAPAAQCALAEGSAACEGYPAAQDDWYTGSDDARECAACACAASGGSCEGVSVQIGSDYSCFDNAVISQNEKSCDSVYAPPIGLVGNPVASTCTAQAAATGTLTPIGRSTLCCLE